MERSWRNKMDRVALIVKIGDQPTASGKKHLGMKEGMPICYIDEKDWGLSLEKIMSPDMHRIFACIQVDRKKLPFIKKMLKPLGGVKNMTRQRKKYIKLKTLERETGIVDLESKLRHRVTKVPLINGMGLTDDLWKGAEGTPEGIENFDINQITAGAATIGVAGTYATWALGFADLGNLTGNLTFTQISNVVEVAATVTTENLAGNTFRNTSDWSHNGDPTRGWRIAYNNGATGLIFCEMEGPGTYIVENLYVVAGAVGNNGALVFFRNIGTAFDFHLCDNLFNCNALFDQGVKPSSAIPVFYMYNNAIWDTANAGGIGAGFSLSLALNANSRVENNVIYGGVRTCWDLINRAAVLTNNYGFNGGGGTFTNIGAATGTNNLADNAQPIDAAWLVGVGNIINAVTGLCVQSINDAQANFLDIVEGGTLDGAGILNTIAARVTGIRGRVVPGPTGTSVGTAEIVTPEPPAVYPAGTVVFGRGNNGMVRNNHKDTALWPFAPNQAYASDPALGILFDPGGIGVVFPLLRFSLVNRIPANANIVSAILTLTLEANSVGAQVCTLYRLLTAWGESPIVEGVDEAPATNGQAVWDNAFDYNNPAVDVGWVAGVGAGFTAADVRLVPEGVFTIGGADVAGTQYTIDVLGMVNFWFPNDVNNVGFIINADVVAITNYIASQNNPNGSWRPFLTVVYAVPYIGDSKICIPVGISI